MSESLFLDELLKLANEVYLQISSPVYIQCFTPKHLRTRKAEWQVYKGLVKLKLDQTQHLSPPAVSSTREWIKYQSNFLVGFSSWRAMPCQLVGVLTLVAWLNEQVVYCLTAADVKPPRIHCRQADRSLSWCACLGLTRHSPATLAKLSLHQEIDLGFRHFPDEIWVEYSVSPKPMYECVFVQ